MKIHGTGSRGGFTVIEVVMAMLLLSVAIFALSKASVSSISAQTDTLLRTTAAAIGKSYMEDVKTRAPETLAPESAVAVNEQGKPTAGGEFQRSLEVESDGENLYRVTVVIDYPRAPGPLRIENIIYDNQRN